MNLADDNDFGIEPRRLLYDKSRCVKYVFVQNTSGNSPSNKFLLKFKMFNPLLLSRFVGIELCSAHHSEFSDIGRDFAGELIVAEFENSEFTQLTDVFRYLTGDFVADELKDSEIW
uniref:Uncharacterized protein n=1 Tax=Solanum lycopersicum TaxID=4081 RepID=A0A3Q7EIC9_SOLLC